MTVIYYIKMENQDGFTIIDSEHEHLLHQQLKEHFHNNQEIIDYYWDNRQTRAIDK